MVRFGDFVGVKELAEANTSQAYKEIVPEQKEPDGPHGYWDAVFSYEPTQVQEVSIDDLLPEIYGRTESEFSFPEAIDPVIQAVLDKFDRAEWRKLSEKEKKTTVEELAGAIANDLGLERIPEIYYFEGPITNQGAYDQTSRTIGLNKALLADPYALVDTIPHELRHAYQHERSLKQETWLDLLYKVNLDPDFYISPVLLPNGKYLFFTDYYDQLVEAEARAYANAFLKKEEHNDFSN